MAVVITRLIASVDLNVAIYLLHEHRAPHKSYRPAHDEQRRAEEPPVSWQRVQSRSVHWYEQKQNTDDRKRFGGAEGTRVLETTEKRLATREIRSTTVQHIQTRG